MRIRIRNPGFVYISQCFSPESGAGAGGVGDQQHNFSAQPPPPPPNSSFTAAAAAQGGPTGTVGGPPGIYSSDLVFIPYLFLFPCFRWLFVFPFPSFFLVFSNYLCLESLSLFFSFNLSVPSLLLRQAQNSRAGQPMVFCARNAGCSLWKSGGFFCSAEGLPGCHFNLRKMCNFIRSKSFSLFGHKKAQFTRNGSKF
jgi:hypothetical protein